MLLLVASMDMDGWGIPEFTTSALVQWSNGDHEALLMFVNVCVDSESRFAPLEFASRELTREGECRLEPRPLSQKLFSVCTIYCDSFRKSRILLPLNMMAPFTCSNVRAFQELFPGRLGLPRIEVRSCWARSSNTCLQLGRQVLNAAYPT